MVWVDIQLHLIQLQILIWLINYELHSTTTIRPIQESR